MPLPISSPGETMNRKRFLAIAVALLVGAGLLYFLGGHQVPPGQAALVNITPQSLSTLKSTFNEAEDDVRLLVLLSPT